MQTYSGFNANTSKNLLLDAGAFFKNFDAETDTFATAKAAGKLIGATSGGGEFNATAEVRQVEIDGVKGRAKGLEAIDSWEVYLKGTFVELSASVVGLALGASDTETDSQTGTKTITARNNIEATDYIDNITWVGTISGSDDPVIIQVFNALSTDGISVTVEDKANATVEATFYGHYDTDDLDTPPFNIIYPSIS